MKSEKLQDAIGEVRDSYIQDAAGKTAGKKNAWMKWAIAAAAACVCLFLGISRFSGSRPERTSVGGVMREYKNASVMGTEEAIEWPWEYKTVFERFPVILFDGREYALKTSVISIEEDLIGNSLGYGDGTGFDVYSEQEYRQDFAIWKIRGVAEDLMIAAEIDGRFYASQRNEYDPPETFGEVLDNYSLAELLPLRRFSRYKDGGESEYYSLADDAYIWRVLAQCRDAQFVEDEAGGRVGRDWIVFTATSAALGTYKRAFYVSADGYISTNIFNWAYTFRIGEEAASDIISYATEHAAKAEREQYLYSLAGTLTEIGEGYILVDDSILCANEQDGMIFKVLTSDLRIRRYIDCRQIGVGSIVVVNFTEPVKAAEGYVIDSAVSMSVGAIYEGDVTVLE